MRYASILWYHGHERGRKCRLVRCTSFLGQHAARSMLRYWPHRAQGLHGPHPLHKYACHACTDSTDAITLRAAPPAAQRSTRAGRCVPHARRCQCSQGVSRFHLGPELPVFYTLMSGPACMQACVLACGRSWGVLCHPPSGGEGPHRVACAGPAQVGHWMARQMRGRSDYCHLIGSYSCSLLCS